MQTHTFLHTRTYLEVNFLLSAAGELLHVGGELDAVLHRLDLNEGSPDPTQPNERSFKTQQERKQKKKSIQNECSRKTLAREKRRGSVWGG